MTLQERIREAAERFYPEVLSLRRHLHAHPELSWKEFETSKLVEATLLKLGFEVQRIQCELGNTGIIGILRTKNPVAKCIALRADMDALPITEQNKVDYCSTNIGVMHACGHDVHTSNLLGTAMILSELRNEIEGTYKFIFQPSEEKIPSGAEAIIKAGVLQNPAPQTIFGLHVSPELEAGTFGFCGGRFMASSDEIYLTIIGKGGHAAQPQNVINPLLVASELLLALKPITNYETPTVLSFGNIEGKGATNVIPEKVEVAGTLRCFDEELRMELHERIKLVCDSIGKSNDAVCELRILKGYPVLINDEELTRKTREAASAFLGEENVLDLPKRMGSEDFAYYTHHLPACFYRLGVGNKSLGITSGLHSPTFNIDESALKESIGLMSWIALNA
jgi:amidohydrolase